MARSVGRAGREYNPEPSKFPVPGPTSPPPAPSENPEAPPAPLPAPPAMPPPVAEPMRTAQEQATYTPLGQGTFALPGTAGAAPFRSLLGNPNISAPGAEGVGSLENLSADNSVQPPLDPEALRRMFAGILGGQ